MKKLYVFILILVFLIGCSPKPTQEYLIGGEWTVKAGYNDGEKSDDPKCIPLQRGVTFKEDELVYVERFERDFQYLLYEEYDEILFRDTGPDLDPKATPDSGVDHFSYEIKITGDDEMELMGRGLLEGFDCTMERESN